MRTPDKLVFGKTVRNQNLETEQRAYDDAVANALAGNRAGILDMIVGAFDATGYDSDNMALRRAREIAGLAEGSALGADAIPDRGGAGGDMKFGRTIAKRGADEAEYRRVVDGILADEGIRVSEMGTWLDSALANKLDVADVLDTIDNFSRGDYRQGAGRGRSVSRPQAPSIGGMNILGQPAPTAGPSLPFAPPPDDPFGPTTGWQDDRSRDQKLIDEQRAQMMDYIAEYAAPQAPAPPLGLGPTTRRGGLF